MNLMTGLIWPTKGKCSVLGLSAKDPERFFRVVGYALSSIPSQKVSPAGNSFTNLFGSMA